MAVKLKKQTTVGWKWIAEKLRMGHGGAQPTPSASSREPLPNMQDSALTPFSFQGRFWFCVPHSDGTHRDLPAGTRVLDVSSLGARIWDVTSGEPASPLVGGGAHVRGR